ncbi:hemolysin family protein [Natronoglycomyces albus]|uniref:HlyC/CorC family transporter n=1 Tax=Natronoglycomyces albus TaxID=2811108 RepID=A0A895XTH0_9ACTN|nr:hemolysin family protein [Natronoglycomyces albus]QSB05550.1 HlyC/CorC family transporter [Natronoglycomyces albus]
MSITVALWISLFLLIANAFFVAAEFALVASRQHRLEQAAAAGSASAKVALRSVKQLSLMLAGAQLGITACTIGLGALAEPAVARIFEPLIADLGFLGPAASHAVAFTIALAIVVFLHMVIGEMMPKSWAITHPETSAALLIWPFAAFVWVTKPLLLVLNNSANRLLRLFKVTPTDEVTHAHSPQELRYLLRESAAAGFLPETEHQMLTHALEVQRTQVRSVMIPFADFVTVQASTTALDAERVSLETGRSRLVVVDNLGRPVGLVHVREAIQAAPATRVDRLMVAPLIVAANQTVSAAVTLLQRQRAQLALVSDSVSATDTAGAGHRVIGLVAMEDLLEEIIGEFDDETDRSTPK